MCNLTQSIPSVYQLLRRTHPGVAGGFHLGALVGRHLPEVVGALPRGKYLTAEKLREHRRPLIGEEFTPPQLKSLYICQLHLFP